MSFDPALGRWTQTDPMGYVDGLNSYEFVGSNPLNYVDPNGTFKMGIHYELAENASIALGMKPGYVRLVAESAESTDLWHFFDSENHAQSNGWIGLVRKHMHTIDYTVTAGDGLADAAVLIAGTMGVALYALQDFFSHTDWIDGNSSLGHTPHHGEIINMDDFYRGATAKYENVSIYTGGENPLDDSPHNKYAADKPGFGRDAFIAGAYQEAYLMAGAQSMAFIKWAKRNMISGIRCIMFER